MQNGISLQSFMSFQHTTFLQTKRNKIDHSGPQLFPVYGHTNKPVAHYETLNQDIHVFCFENSVDQDQLASEKPVDQDPKFFTLHLLIGSCMLIGYKLGRSVVHKISSMIRDKMDGTVTIPT